MSRILVYGVAPLPFEDTQKNYGPGIRSWQFARALAQAGHEVRLVAVTLEDAYVTSPVASEVVEGVEIRRLPQNQFVDENSTRQLIAAFAPAAVVGATVYGSYALAVTRPAVPFWADQFGHVMAEAQAKSALDGHPQSIPYFWNLVRTVIQRADRISVVSERQKWAAVGELGAIGRLNYRTIGHDFLSVLPCALLPASFSPATSTIRRREVGDPFRVLWSGSYNTWSDVRTLAQGLERAMERNSRVRFVSTGGDVPGHDECTYRDLVERVHRSRFVERFELLGWIMAHDLPGIVADSDLGVLTEKPIYEGMLGSKNRVVQWMSAGLAVAYNHIGDLGDLLERERIGLTFPVGSADALADRICWAAEHPEELERMAERARDYALGHLTIEATTRELVAWAQDPSFAPDAGLEVGQGMTETIVA